MTGIYIASEKYPYSTSSNKNWINRTPSAALHNNGTPLGFGTIGSTLYGLYTSQSSACRILSTTDIGVSWTNITAASTVIGTGVNSSYAPRMTKFNNRLTIANGSNYIYSDDGTNWNKYVPATTLIPTSLFGIFWNGSTWITVGENTQSPKQRVWRSTVSLPSVNSDWSPGVAVDVANTFNNGPARDTAYGFGKWWVVGQSTVAQPQVYQSSDDGQSWSSNASALSVSQGNSLNNSNRVKFLNGRLYVLNLNANTQFMYSNDGTNFSLGNFNFTSAQVVYDITYSPELGQYVAIANDAVGFSADGLTWVRDNGLQTAWSTSSILGRSITWLGNGYIAGGSAGNTAWLPVG